MKSPVQYLLFAEVSESKQELKSVFTATRSDARMNETLPKIEFDSRWGRLGKGDQVAKNIKILITDKLSLIRVQVAKFSAKGPPVFEGWYTKRLIHNRSLTKALAQIQTFLGPGIEFDTPDESQWKTDGAIHLPVRLRKI